MKKTNRDIIGIFACGTGILLITVLVYADYFQPEWKAISRSSAKWSPSVSARPAQSRCPADCN
ncbi:MAG TPA: hypothetical protein VFU86_03820, partial [Terriglobales bacterium]|nr:hypothetical protein [Terriglobales bacterium]